MSDGFIIRNNIKYMQIRGFLTWTYLLYLYKSNLGYVFREVTDEDFKELDYVILGILKLKKDFFKRDRKLKVILVILAEYIR